MCAGSDFPHPFQLRFSKEGVDHIVQNRHGSDVDGLVRVWPNAVGLEASWCARIIGPGFWQNTTGPLPVSHFQTRLRSATDGPGHNYCAKPARIRFRFWLTVSGQVLAKRIWSGSKPVCKDHLARFWPTLPIRADTDLIWQVYYGK